jgi:flagellar biosynthesis protein FlhB
VSDSKPFAATPNRVARARREGQGPHASEPCVIAACAGGLTAAALSVPPMLGCAANAIAAAARERTVAASTGGIAAMLGWAIVPLAAAAACAIAAGIADGGLRTSMPGFDGKRVDPIAGFRRMFSRDALVAAARAAAAFAAAIAGLALLARDAFSGALEAIAPAALASFARSVALRSCLSVLAVGALFALLDRWSAQRRWLENLRMTHEELKRDIRESEGDPQARGRRLALHRAIVRGSLARVREASFVVANPDHVAVALKYAPPGVPVPEILVRACDEGARRVKALAAEHGIPIVENVPLARALFAQGEAGETIPRDLYVAVAQIVAALVDEGLAP